MNNLKLGVILLLLLLSQTLTLDKSYYKTLEVDQDADEAAIKRAYRKQALQWHPDRNQDKKEIAEKRFQQVAQAYEVLSDPKKRQLYDQYGEQGVEGGAAAGGGGGGGGSGGAHFTQYQQSGSFGGQDPLDLFNMMFGGEGMGGKGAGGAQFQQFTFSTDDGDFMQFGGGGRQQRGGRQRTARGGFHDQQQHFQQQQQQQQSQGYYENSIVVEVKSKQQMKTSKDILAMYKFYAPWCGHCKNLVPAYKKAANKLKDIVPFYAINCEDQKSLCQQYSVRGYPTLMAKNSNGQMVDYKGERTAKALQHFAQSLLGDPVVKVNSNSLEKFLGKCQGGQWNWKSRNQDQSWHLCVLLLSNKTEPTSLYKLIANKYANKVVFAQGSINLAKTLGIQQQPQLIAFCNGNKQNMHVLDDLNQASINDFIQSFQDQSRCVDLKQIDLSQQSVSVLKNLVKSKGLECKGCAEKQDYIKLMQQFQTG